MRAQQRTRIRAVMAAVGLAVSATVAGCDDPAQPGLAIEGGGFIFNYREADVTYGIAVKPLRRFAAGTVLEAQFDDPAGGPALTVIEPLHGKALSYALKTPPVYGVKVDTPYKVIVRAKSAAGVELARVERTLRSDLDQSIMPDRPVEIRRRQTQ